MNIAGLIVLSMISLDDADDSAAEERVAETIYKSPTRSGSIEHGGITEREELWLTCTNQRIFHRGKERREPPRPNGRVVVEENKNLSLGTLGEPIVASGKPEVFVRSKNSDAHSVACGAKRGSIMRRRTVVEHENFAITGIAVGKKTIKTRSRVLERAVVKNQNGKNWKKAYKKVEKYATMRRFSRYTCLQNKPQNSNINSPH